MRAFLPARPSASRPLLALLLALASCGGDEPAPPPSFATSFGIDLLAREPALLLDRAGAVSGRPSAEWRSIALSGWNEGVFQLGGSACCTSAVERPLLELVAGEPTARVIEIELVGPTEARSEVELVLNGISIGAAALGPEPTRTTIETPAEAWVRGLNQLALVGPAPTELDPDTAPVSFGLIQLAWDTPARAWHDASTHGARLDPEAGLAWDLVGVRAGELVLRCLTEAAGDLDVRFAPLDSERGEERRGEATVARAQLPAGSSEQRIPLPAHDGSPLRIELGWRGAQGVEFVGVDLAAQSDAARPNVLFVSLDTLAARHMSLYGYEQPTTPRMQAFAADAVVFEHAWSNAPWTVPSYVSQLFGLYPDTLRYGPRRGQGSLFGYSLPRTRITLAEILQQAGYATAAFVDSPWLQASHGFDQGFAHFDSRASEVGLEDVDGGLRLVLERARPWLQEASAGDAPWFLFLQAVDVHAPYTPPSSAAGELGPYEPGPELPVAPLGGVFSAFPPYVVRAGDPEAVLPERAQPGPFTQAYDEEILAVDRMLGDYLDELEASGLLENTLVVISADHGESMTEHEWFFDHGPLYEEVLHVPLVVRPPGGIAGGRRVRASVQLVDLYPTFAELVGWEPPAWAHGASLQPYLDGGERAPRNLLAEGPLQEGNALLADGWKLIEIHPGRAALQALLSHPRARPLLEPHVDGLLGKREDVLRILEACKQSPDLASALHVELSAALDGPYYELYHLESDPLELVDRAADEPERVASMRALLERERAPIERGRANTRIDGAPPALSAEVRAELQALGYLGEELGD